MRKRRPSRRDRGDDERGAATILTVAMSGVVLLLGVALSAVAGLVVAHRQAQSAADLAALAGAAAVAQGGDGCAAAAGIATANGADQTSCQVDGRDVVITVVVPGPRWGGYGGDLSASARAGPS